MQTKRLRHMSRPHLVLVTPISSDEPRQFRTGGVLSSVLKVDSFASLRQRIDRLYFL